LQYVKQLHALEVELEKHVQAFRCAAHELKETRAQSVELCDRHLGSKVCRLVKGHGGAFHVSWSGTMWNVGTK
jgi:hypothetical protein